MRILWVAENTAGFTDAAVSRKIAFCRMTQFASHLRLMVLMFTDLVGSMEIKTRHGVPAYAALISRHDQLFHAAMHEEGGGDAEVMQDTGDGYFARS